MPKDAKELVRLAFEMAQKSGKDDWRRMTLAVFKNRLLQLTHRAFRETDYGASNLRDFLNQLGDVVKLDTDAVPIAVELLDSSTGGELLEVTTSDRSAGGRRIREDLWRAVLDYSSGRRYVWDKDHGLARPADGDEAEDWPGLPTLTLNEFDSWRQEFLKEHRDQANPEELSRLRTWTEQRQPTFALPGRLRGPWNGELKRRVSQRLEEWFARESIALPADILVAALSHGVPKSSHGANASALRKLVITCVGLMTEEELSELRFSPAVILRARLSAVPR